MSARRLDSDRADDPLVVVRSDFWNFNAIGLRSEGQACVVDPGIRPEDMQLLQRELAAPVSEVLITHSHHDHIRGWQHFPGARVSMPCVAAHKSEQARERILRAKSRIDEKLGAEDPGYAYPRAERVFEETLELRVGAQPVEMIFVPGHSDCTSVVLFPDIGTLCTADYLVSPGLPYCRWRAHEFEQALAFLGRLCRERGVQRVVPAHNELLLGLDAIEAALDEERRYFEHMRARLVALNGAGLRAEAAVREVAREMSVRRGVELGGRERQDADNARRVQAELADQPAASG